MKLVIFFFYRYGDHRELHEQTHSFPTRRSSELTGPPDSAGAAMTLLIRPLPRPLRLRSAPSMVSLPAKMRSVPPEPAACGSAQSTSWKRLRSEEHTSELQSLMRISYAVFCLKKKN